MGKQLPVLQFRSGTMHVAHLSNQEMIKLKNASHDQNFGISNHNFHCLISAYDKRECELLKKRSQSLSSKRMDLAVKVW